MTPTQYVKTILYWAGGSKQEKDWTPAVDKKLVKAWNSFTPSQRSFVNIQLTPIEDRAKVMRRQKKRLGF